MPSLYCTADEIRTHVGITGTTGIASDSALQAIIYAVSQAIDNYCNRPEGFMASNNASARVYVGTGKPYLRIDECIAITIIEVKSNPADSAYVSVPNTDWIAFQGAHDTPNFNQLPYDGIMFVPGAGYSIFPSGVYGGVLLPSARVTAKWGYAAEVPPAIKQATISLVARWWKQGQSAWADTLASVELGQLLYQRENSDISKMLVRYTRPVVG